METKKLRAYGQWADNPKGTPEDVTRCIATVWDNGRGMHQHQCNRKRGFGVGGLYCKQHDPERIKAIDAAKEAKWQAMFAQRADARGRDLALTEMAKGIPTNELCQYELRKK